LLINPIQLAAQIVDRYGNNDQKSHHKKRKEKLPDAQDGKIRRTKKHPYLLCLQISYVSLDAQFHFFRGLKTPPYLSAVCSRQSAAPPQSIIDQVFFICAQWPLDCGRLVFCQQSAVGGPPPPNPLLSAGRWTADVSGIPY
jgi:hypothetical protein